MVPLSMLSIESPELVEESVQGLSGFLYPTAAACEGSIGSRRSRFKRCCKEKNKRVRNLEVDDGVLQFGLKAASMPLLKSQ